MGNLLISISITTYLTKPTKVLSLPTIEFKPVAAPKYIYQSQQEKTNANILEHAYCKFNTFKDPSSPTPTYYHWYTQTIANYTSVSILDDTLKQYTTPDTTLASQLPYQLYYAYTTFDTCVSPTTNDIFSCYVLPSCCFGCAFINCNIFYNNATAPSWSDLNFFITGNEPSGSFAQKPQVTCMDDGYVVSWIYAKRQGPPSDNCLKPHNIGDMVFSDYKIQYGTVDLDANMKLSNETLFKFDTFDLVTAVNNFEVMRNDKTLYMTFGYNITQKKMSYLNVSNIVVGYNGINKELELQSTQYLYNDEGDSYLNENQTATYKSIMVDVTNDCCFVTTMKTPMYQKSNKEDTVSWYMNVRYFNGTIVSIMYAGKQVGFVDVIELTMLNDEKAIEKYFAVVYDDVPHSINVQTFYLDYTGNEVRVEKVGDIFQLTGNDKNAKTDDYIYSFCTNILPNSTDMVMAWAENPNEVNTLTNVYIGSWEVIAQT